MARGDFLIDLAILGVLGIGGYYAYQSGVFCPAFGPNCQGTSGGSGTQPQGGGAASQYGCDDRSLLDAADAMIAGRISEADWNALVQRCSRPEVLPVTQPEIQVFSQPTSSSVGKIPPVLSLRPAAVAIPVPLQFRTGLSVGYAQWEAVIRKDQMRLKPQSDFMSVDVGFSGPFGMGCGQYNPVKSSPGAADMPFSAQMEVFAAGPVVTWRCQLQISAWPEQDRRKLIQESDAFCEAADEPGNKFQGGGFVSIPKMNPGIENYGDWVHPTRTFPFDKPTPGQCCSGARLIHSRSGPEGMKLSAKHLISPSGKVYGPCSGMVRSGVTLGPIQAESGIWTVEYIFYYEATKTQGVYEGKFRWS